MPGTQGRAIISVRNKYSRKQDCLRKGFVVVVVVGGVVQQETGLLA